MSGTASRTSKQALERIAGAPAPARVRELLESVYLTAVEVLYTPLQLTMVELERALFQSAEKARNSQVQADVYAQMRLLRDTAERFPKSYLDALAAQLADLKSLPTPVAEERAKPSFKTMTLVEDTDIDRDIVLHDMARRESSRGVSAMQLLGQRFAVLAAQPAFDSERLPTGPYSLCRALRDSGEQLQVNLETQLLLYQVFDRQAMERHTELCDRLNILLAREGILPGLVYRPYLARPSAPRGHGPGTAAGNPADAPRNAGQAPLTSWQGQGPAASWTQLPNAAPAAAPAAASANPQADAAGAASLHALLDAARQTLSRQAPATGGSIASLAANTVDASGQSIFAGAGVAAGAAMQPQPGVGPQAGTSPALPPMTSPQAAPKAVPSDAVMGVLGKLQAQAAAPGARRGFKDIHDALLAQLRAEHGSNAALSSQDADTLDLLGMLYTQIQREVRTEGPAADLLNQLQVPLARAAIHDQNFFQRDQHPARELLNAVAESGAVWLSDDDSDPMLLYKLGEAVEKVVTDYEGDESVFVEANERIQTHLRGAARRAEVAERRQVEAARGKEKLEAAKQLANRSIDELCASEAPPKFVQTLLRKAWADVLTLTLLRQGELSDEWQQRLQATRRISQITRLPPGGAPDIAFGEQIEDSLLQVGYHRDEAGAIARRLSSPGGGDDVTSKTELSAKLKARSRLGEAGDRDEEEERRKNAQPERNATEEGFYRQLRTLPFGTWFEFTINQQGDSRRQRLSWYSLITDNALFVNQRGQKVAEHSLDALARLMAGGQLRIVTEDRGRLIDRAWQATLRTLRAIAGTGTNAAEGA